MPTVTRSDCTQVDLTESIKIAFDSRSSTFTGKLTDVHIDFNACRGIHNQNNDLWAYMARLYYQGDITPNQFGEAGRTITNGHCVESDRYALNEKNLHVGYDADADRWTHVAGRDELYDGPPFGRNMFMKSFFEHSLTAPSQENIVNGTFSAGETPIMMRVCATCQRTHRYVFYRRLTPVTDVSCLVQHQRLRRFVFISDKHFPVLTSSSTSTCSVKSCTIEEMREEIMSGMRISLFIQPTTKQYPVRIHGSARATLLTMVPRSLATAHPMVPGSKISTASGTGATVPAKTSLTMSISHET